MSFRLRRRPSCNARRVIDYLNAGRRQRPIHVRIYNTAQAPDPQELARVMDRELGRARAR